MNIKNEYPNIKNLLNMFRMIYTIISLLPTTNLIKYWLGALYIKILNNI